VVIGTSTINMQAGFTV